MARGKYLSLEEARKMGKLNQFAKEHPAEGDAELFDSNIGNIGNINKRLSTTTSSAHECEADAPHVVARTDYLGQRDKPS